MTSLSRARTLVAALAAAGALTLTACSSSDTPAPSTSAASVSGSETSLSEPTDNTATSGYTGLNTTGDSAASTEPNANTVTETAPQTTAPAVTTVVPVPGGGGGGINETVPSTSRSTASDVPLTATAEAGNGVAVKVASLEQTTTTAQLPGEIAGAGVKVTLSVVNGSATALDLGNVVVDLQDANGVSQTAMSATPASPFTGSLAPGATASGIYVFTFTADYANPAKIFVTLPTEVPVLVFAGDAK